MPFEIPAGSPVQYILLQGDVTANGALVKLKFPKGLACFRHRSRAARSLQQLDVEVWARRTGRL